MLTVNTTHQTISIHYPNKKVIYIPIDCLTSVSVYPSPRFSKWGDNIDVFMNVDLKTASDVIRLEGLLDYDVRNYQVGSGPRVSDRLLELLRFK
jgi:hypothetical protein